MIDTQTHPTNDDSSSPDKGSYLREWILPTVTTFVGVFAAAWLTIWSENAKEDENILMLLEVAFTDACSALTTAEQANRQLAANKDLHTLIPISEPRIMLSVLKDNATVFADFHEPLTRELLSHLSVIEDDIRKYAAQLEQVRIMLRITPLVLSSKERDRDAQIMERETERLAVTISTSADRVKATLLRLALLIELQLGLKQGELSVKQVDARLSDRSIAPGCIGDTTVSG